MTKYISLMEEIQDSLRTSGNFLLKIHNGILEGTVRDEIEETR